MVQRKRILLMYAALLLISVLIFQTSHSAQSDKFQEDLSRGETLLNQRKYEDAVNSFKSAIRGSRSFTGAALAAASMQANWGLSRAYLALGAHKNAIQSCDEALKSVGTNASMEAMIRNQRGLAILAAVSKPGDPYLEQAVSEFRKVMAITDKDPTVSYNLGVALLRLNKDDEGVHELQVYVARAGGTAEANTARKMIEQPRRARENFAPDFSLTTKDGEYITLDDLKGKVVLLDFWGTWCGPCRESTPSLVRYSKKHSSEVFTMIGVAVSEPNEAGWRNYIDKNKMAWAQYLDSTRKISSVFKVTAYPTYLVIDAEGVIRDRRSGWDTETMNNIDNYVKKAVKDGKKEPQITRTQSDRNSLPVLMPPAPVASTAAVATPTVVRVAPPAPVPNLPTVVAAANTPSTGGVNVRGRVTRLPSSLPTVGVPQATRVNLIKPGPAATPIVPVQAVINVDGTFEFPNVQPGTYTMSITIPVPPQQITVGNTDINGIEFTAMGIKGVTGGVFIQGLSSAPRMTLTVIHPSGTINMGIATQADGSIGVLLPEGEHRVTLSVPGYTVRSFSYGSTDLLKDPLKVTNANEQLTVTLVANPGTTPTVAPPQRGARGAPPVVPTGPRGTPSGPQ